MLAASGGLRRGSYWTSASSPVPARTGLAEIPREVHTHYPPATAQEEHGAQAPAKRDKPYWRIKKTNSLLEWKGLNRAMTFAMICEKRPPSAANGPYVRFQDAIRDQAGRAWSGKPFLTGRLYARIVWLHSQARGDVEIVAGKILGALEGIVFQDGSSVAEALAGAVDLRDTYDVSIASLPQDLPDALVCDLLTLLAAAPKHALYIEVSTSPTPHIAFGPVQGEPG